MLGEVNEAIGDDEDIAATKGNIAIAKFIYEGASNNEELLKANEELYELRVAKHGEDDFILWERLLTVRQWLNHNIPSPCGR